MLRAPFLLRPRARGWCSAQAGRISFTLPALCVGVLAQNGHVSRSEGTPAPGAASAPSFPEIVEAAAGGRIPALLVVQPVPSLLLLEPDPGLADISHGPALLASSGTMQIQVFSALPQWSVAVDVVSIRGPAGATLSRARLQATAGAVALGKRPALRPRLSHRSRAKPPAPGRESPPAAHLLEFHSPTPPRSVTSELLRFEVRPRWTDAPGTYTAMIRLRPVPPSGRLGPPASGALERAFGSLPTTDATVSFTIMPFVSLALPQSRLDLVVDPLDGGVETEVEFKVTTNSRVWFVDCLASEFVGEQESLSVADRITWERLGPWGQVIESGRLDHDRTVAHGARPGVEIPVRLRFRLTLGMDARAGLYRGSLSLAVRTEG